MDITSEVRFARNRLGQFASHLDAAAIGALKEILAVGEAAATSAAPEGPPRDDYGRRPKLKGDIHTVLVSSRSGVIRISAINALSQQTGAGGHEIHGNPRLFFFWIKAGRWVNPPRVNHPGNPPQPFMEAGFEAMDEAAEGILAKWYG